VNFVLFRNDFERLNACYFIQFLSPVLQQNNQKKFACKNTVEHTLLF
jgi:hypothetical protein